MVPMGGQAIESHKKDNSAVLSFVVEVFMFSQFYLFIWINNVE